MFVATPRGDGERERILDENVQFRDFMIGGSCFQLLATLNNLSSLDEEWGIFEFAMI